MKIPPLLKPDSATMFGYTGGMALFVPNWKSITHAYTFNRRHKKRKIIESTVYELYKHFPINKN